MGGRSRTCSATRTRSFDTTLADAVDDDGAPERALAALAGAVLTTAEATAFEWLGGSAHPQFKAVRRLVQERMGTPQGG